MKVPGSQLEVLEHMHNGAQFVVIGGIHHGHAQLTLSGDVAQTVYMPTARALINKGLIVPMWPHQALRVQGYRLTRQGREVVE